MPKPHFTYTSDYEIGDRVHVDGDSSISAVVTAVLWRTENPQLEITWWHNGAQQSCWVADWRLSHA